MCAANGTAGATGAALTAGAYAIDASIATGTARSRDTSAGGRGATATAIAAIAAIAARLTASSAVTSGYQWIGAVPSRATCSSAPAGR